MVANRYHLPCKQQAAHLSLAAHQAPQQQILESDSWNAAQQQLINKLESACEYFTRASKKPICYLHMHVNLCSTCRESIAAVPVIRSSKEDNVLAHEDSSV